METKNKDKKIVIAFITAGIAAVKSAHPAAVAVGGVILITSVLIAAKVDSLEFDISVTNGIRYKYKK